MSHDSKVPFAPDPFGGVVIAVSPSSNAARDGYISRVGASGDFSGRVSLPDGSVSSMAVFNDRAVVVTGHCGLQPRMSSAPTEFRKFGIKGSRRVQKFLVAKYDGGANRQ
ncbi:MAG: hypothetical protein CSA75_04180 [Sorangium cellulosum]|nr:MAG: hypothetical protein CSA75_04180 [Sorangium cellulosum]